jgi:hypothetical protein
MQTLPYTLCLSITFHIHTKKQNRVQEFSY